MVLGLTGGIASGKSSVSKFFLDLGAKIIDADLIAREVAEDKIILEAVCLEFGEKAVENNTINRKYIADIIFSNPEKREKLNSIMHPVIISKIKKEIEENRNNNLVIADIPLLYETGFETEVDKVAVVYIDKNTQIDRLINRDNLSEDKAVKRIESQMSLEEKASKADILINNTGTIDELKEKITKLYNKLK